MWYLEKVDHESGAVVERSGPFDSVEQARSRIDMLGAPGYKWRVVNSDEPLDTGRLSPSP